MNDRFLGIGHHPFSKKLEFRGFLDNVCPCLIATDYKAPKCILEETMQTANGLYTNDSKAFHRGELKDMSRTLKAYKHDAGVAIRGGNKDMRIRKLTPKECFRLMGFADEDHDKAAEVVSNSQLYKQAGNSIVVDVIEEIFCQIFDENGELYA